MKILLADRQDITRAGLSYVIEKMEGLESKYVEDKAELMLALKETPKYFHAYCLNSINLSAASFLSSPALKIRRKLDT